jgi:hypothetical protein
MTDRHQRKLDAFRDGQVEARRRAALREASSDSGDSKHLHEEKDLGRSATFATVDELLAKIARLEAMIDDQQNVIRGLLVALKRASGSG